MASQPKQLRFFKDNNPCFGGGLLNKGNPRQARPLSLRSPIHLVLKSQMAIGPRSMLNRKASADVWRIVETQAKKCGIKIYQYANGGNHLHIVVKIQNVQMFKKYVRAVTGLIARAVLGAERGSRQLKSSQRFWQARPFTRIVSWGKAYDRLKKYVVLNTFEAIGFIKHQPRGKGSARGRPQIASIKIEPD